MKKASNRFHVTTVYGIDMARKKKEEKISKKLISKKRKKENSKKYKF